MVWSHLDVTKAHVAYACIGVFSCVFSLVSLFFKEKLYLGESSVAVLFGLIVGPHCLNWFDPTHWGNTDSITLEISRVVLCLQIFAVAVELPRKYMLKHWLSVTMLLVPVMTAGWLITGLFVWILIPGLNFSDSLLVSACVTATDPILAQSVVSGKFAQRVPGHLRNLLSAESGCNDGMAFPFIFLSLNLIIYKHDAAEITKDWICVTLLYECIFGCILGAFIGYTGRRAIRFAEEKNLIDRESFLAFYVFLALMCAGFGSMLGVDDLLVSFAAGTAFSWDGWFSQSTEESNVSTVIDLVLNLAYFVFFGAIIPWDQFNNASIGLSVWRPVLLAIAVICLRRIPAVLAFKPFIPDIKSWREALFVGHFGPIGVGAIFAAILARAQLEAHATGEETPLKVLPEKGSEYWQLISVIWPLVCFLVLTSIIVHGSSVAVFTLGRHLNTITLTKSFTIHTTNGNGLTSKWMDRLPGLESEGRSFSLHRVDTMGSGVNKKISRQNTVETSGIPAKAAGGMRSRKNKKSEKRGLRHRHSDHNGRTSREMEREMRQKEAQAAAFALSKDDESDLGMNSFTSLENPNTISQYSSNGHDSSETVDVGTKKVSGLTPKPTFIDDKIPFPSSETSGTSESSTEKNDMSYLPSDSQAHVAYQEGDRIIVENKEGEILNEAHFLPDSKDIEDNTSLCKTSSNHTLESLKRVLTPTRLKRRTLIDADTSKKYYAYKYGDQLVIETDHGEILRRYQINQHDSNEDESPVRARSGSMVSRALSMVKLGKTPSSKDSKSSRLKSDSPTSLNSARRQSFNKKISRQLTPLPIAPNLLEEDEDEDEDEENEDEDETSDRYDEESDSEEDDDEDDDEDDEEDESIYDEQETPVERARRLTALGISSAPRNVDDEED